MHPGSIRDVAVALRTVDPAEPDDSDLAVLREVVGGARVVCLGESAHFVSEFYRLRDRMLRFLVRDLEFSAFVFESGLPEGLTVDDWVRGGPGNLAEVARTGITYGFGRCTEMHTQLAWMRNWNTTHDHQVGFYGMDVPGWCANPGPGVAACLARIPPQPGDRELLTAANLGEPIRVPSPDAAGAPAGLSRGIDRLVERAAAAGDDIALHCALGAQPVVEFLNHGLYPGAGRNLRNEVMAENLRWILEREDRILVGAHNVHVQRTPSFDGTAPIGSLLAPVLGDDLVVIGTTRAAGAVPEPPNLDADPDRRLVAPADEPVPLPGNCLDAVLDTAGPLHLVDLRHTPLSILAEATAMLAQTVLIDLDPKQAFDAVIHVRRITMFRSIGPSRLGAARPRGSSKPPPASLHSGDMADLLFDAVERAQLSDLFDELGPEAPTLLDRWTTRDLAAHLVLRERAYLAGPGLVLPGTWGRFAERRRRVLALRDFAGLIATIRSGPPPGFFRIGWVRRFPTLNEFFVHHEDVRRANGRGPRTNEHAMDEALWRNVSLAPWFLARRLRGAGLELQWAGTAKTVRARWGEPTARIAGSPGELLLYLFGRQGAAHVEVSGPDAAVEVVRRARFGM